MSESKRNNLPPTAPPPARSREERLAARLRENLRRRKAQARQMRESDPPDLPKSPGDG